MGGGGKSLIINELARYTEVLDNGLGAVEAEELLEIPKDNEYKSSLELSSATDDLPNGAKYVILAYKKNGTTYTFDKEATFTVGSKSEIILTGNQNYTLVIISTGTSSLPEIIGKSYFTAARFWISRTDPNIKFLYQRIDNFVANGNIAEDVINVKLKNKSSSIRIELDSSDIMGGNQGGRKITSVKNAKLTYIRPEQVEMRISDSQQMVSPETKETSVEILFPSIVNSTLVMSNYVENIVIENNSEIIFTADINVEGLPEVKHTKFYIRGIRSGYRQSFRSKMSRCGAYLGAKNTEWRQFMCHNLGSDYSKNPFVPNANIHGDKYQWGYKTPIVKQKDDVYESGPVSGWNQVRKENTWNIGKEDPCPAGYRVPTRVEAENLLKYNELTVLGNWDTTSQKASGALAILGDNLPFPAAGRRYWDGSTTIGNLVSSKGGADASFWTNAQNIDNIAKEYRAYSCHIYKRRLSNGSYKKNISIGVTNAGDKRDSHSIRCIKN